MNRSLIQVKNFISALRIGPSEHIEWSAGPYLWVTLKDGRTVSRWVPYRTRTGTPSALLGDVGKIQHMNLHRACSVLFRPPHKGLIYVDCDADVGGWKAVSRMLEDGIRPRVVVESSPGSFQVWLETPHGISPVDLYCATEWRYGADPGAHPSGKGMSRYGRLPGFKNTKPSKGQFACIKRSTRKVFTSDMNEPTARLVTDYLACTGRKSREPDESVELGPGSTFRSTEAEADNGCALTSGRQDLATDQSLIDIKRARYLAGQGFSYQDVKRKIAAARGSDLEVKKAGRVDDILSRAACKALHHAGRWSEVPESDRDRYSHLIR